MAMNDYPIASYKGCPIEIYKGCIDRLRFDLYKIQLGNCVEMMICKTTERNASAIAIYMIYVTHHDLMKLYFLSKYKYSSLHLYTRSYSFACSSLVKTRRGGPARLPSPSIVISSSSSDTESRHCWRKASGAVPSKQSATYFPRIGRNLNALKQCYSLYATTMSSVSLTGPSHPWQRKVHRHEDGG